MERKYFQLYDRKFDLKEVVPESVGEGIITKIGELKNNPTQEMREWHNAITDLKSKLSSRK